MTMEQLNWDSHRNVTVSQHCHRIVCHTISYDRQVMGS